MNLNSIRQATVRTGALALCGLALATVPPRRLQLARHLRLERRVLSPQRPRARGLLSTWRSRIR
jgi:hypothetical protein